MISPERLEIYRRMTPGQRLSLSLEMTREAMKHLNAGPPEVVERRFERMRQQKRIATERICEALARHKAATEAKLAAESAESASPTPDANARDEKC